EHPTIESLSSALDTRRSRLIGSGPPTPRPLSGRSHRRDEPRGNIRAALLQTLGLYFVFGVRALEWVTPYLVLFLLLFSGHSILVSVSWAVVGAMATFPLLLLVALAAKWIVLGRIRPGRHPLWGG